MKTERIATADDLSYVPIDDINPQIDNVLADFQITQGDWKHNQFTFGVPDGSIYAPIGRGANPGGLAVASVHQFVNLEPVEDVSTLTPTFKWDFNGQKNDNGDVCAAPVDPNDVQSVDLYVSVFDQGQGLLPGDTWPGLQPSVPPLNDENPNRIITAYWTKDSGWTWGGKPDPREGNSQSSFQLPSSFRLYSKRLRP